MKVFAFKVLSLAIMLLSNSAYAEFAVIDDVDGFVNVRDSKTHKKVVAKVLKNEVFWVWGGDYTDEKSEWQDVQLNDDPIHTFSIHRSRIKVISPPYFLGVKQVVESVDRGAKFFKPAPVNTLAFSGLSVEVKLAWQAFDEKNHKIGRSKEGYVATIDGQKPWGVDGGLPRYSLNKLQVSYKGKNIPLPSKLYSSLYEINAYAPAVFWDDKNQIIYIQIMGSDGAGAYASMLQVPVSGQPKTMTLIPF